MDETFSENDNTSWGNCTYISLRLEELLLGDKELLM